MMTGHGRSRDPSAAEARHGGLRSWDHRSVTAWAAPREAFACREQRILGLSSRFFLCVGGARLTLDGSRSLAVRRPCLQAQPIGVQRSIADAATSIGWNWPDSTSRAAVADSLDATYPRSMTRDEPALILFALLLLPLGCQDRHAPATPSNATEQIRALPDEAESTQEATEPPEPLDVVEHSDATGSTAPDEPTSAQIAAQPLPQTRDLGAELQRAVGNIADCIRDYRPAAATTIRVRVSAVVRPTGMLIEASASGSGLSMNDARCIEARVGAVLLEPLAGEASRPVTTTIAVLYEPAVVEEYGVAPPPPPPKGVVQALPKKKPIAPSGQPIEGPAADPIEGPEGVPIDGPDAVPIEGPRGIPIGSE